MAREEVAVVPNDKGIGSQGAVQEAGDTGQTRKAAGADVQSNIPPELQPDANGNPPVITERLLRKMRARYFTVKHVQLTNCGHKLDMINQPKTNCENCWFTFFNTHPQLVEVTDQFFRTQGKGPLIGMRGLKYTKMFLRYMATIVHFMNEEKKAKEKENESSNQEPGTTGSTQ